MSILYVILSYIGMGVLGGVLNCFMTGEFKLPNYDSGVWRPGWLGNVIIGGFAAFLVAVFNSPLGQFTLLGPQNPTFELTIGQVAQSILVGTGGGNIITLMAQKNALSITNNELISALKNVAK